MKNWYDKEIDEDWTHYRNRFMHLLQEESELEELVRLVGVDALAASDRLKLEVARSVREDFLHQDAFHEVDTYTSLKKQLIMMRLILNFYEMAQDAAKAGVNVDDIITVNGREAMGRIKYTPEQDVEKEYERITETLRMGFEKLKSEAKRNA